MAAKQSNWKYCIKTTNEHTVSVSHPECIEEIHSIYKDEGGSKSKFSKEVAIDLDSLEIYRSKTSKSDLNRTVDMSFGIINGNQKRMVLTEFKLNCTNPNNLSKKEIEGKLSYSKTILGNQPQILDTYYFIFVPKLKAQANSVLRRINQNKPNFKAMDIGDLADEFI